ncbi:MAG TPA: hypothetical protein VH560_16205 [Polyangia bacterium]|nr:hypothetical protein [Polyangia bacterium]
MSTRSSRNCFATLAVAFTLASGLACTRSSGPAPQTASQQDWDAGLPAPTPSTKKGLIVPADLGAGTGPSGPGTSSGSGATASPPGSLQPPGGGT